MHHPLFSSMKTNSLESFILSMRSDLLLPAVNRHDKRCRACSMKSKTHRRCLPFLLCPHLHPTIWRYRAESWATWGGLSHPPRRRRSRSSIWMPTAFYATLKACQVLSTCSTLTLHQWILVWSLNIWYWSLFLVTPFTAQIARVPVEILVSMLPTIHCPVVLPVVR